MYSFMNVPLERRFSFAVFPISLFRLLYVSFLICAFTADRCTYTRTSMRFALFLRPDLCGTKATAVPQVDFPAELVELFSTLS